MSPGRICLLRQRMTDMVENPQSNCMKVRVLSQLFLLARAISLGQPISMKETHADYPQLRGGSHSHGNH